MSRILVALGGNALLRKENKGTIHEEFANTRTTCRELVKLIKAGHELVITHGNGPQVGAIFLQNIASAKRFPSMPLGICVAETQGLIGYMIQQVLKNTLIREGIDKEVVSVVTQVLVDDKDLSFKNPTKPIGPFFSKKEAGEKEQQGHVLKEDKARGGWRIVVPSPKPKAIIEAPTIKKLVDNGVIVIASGGGGMPVVHKNDKTYDGREAVVDKDLAGGILAEDVDADILLILTDIEKVAINFGKPDQKNLDTITIEDAKKYLAAGEFGEGSMAPKITAAIKFAEGGGTAIISPINGAEAALAGKAGTRIVK